MSAVVFRTAVRRDLPRIVALLADDVLGSGRESADDLQPYERAFALVDADPSELLLVAEQDGEVVGTLQLSFLPGLTRGGASRAQVEGVRVAREARGVRLGQDMLAFAVEQARAWGCTLLQLTTDKTRQDAHRFYERLGFVASHEGYKLTL